MKYWLFLLLLSTKLCAFVVYENTKIWNQDSITFYFLDGTVQQQSEVKRFAKLWQKYTGIKFKYSQTKPSIFTFKKHYTISFEGNSNESTEGGINGFIHLGHLSEDIIFRKKTILHEFGHMLGISHEHQRDDRPEHFSQAKLNSSCMKNQKQSRSWCIENLSKINENEVFVQSGFDSDSVMHYDLKNIFGKDYNHDLLELASTNSLSYIDKYFIAMLYNQNLSDEQLDKMHKQDLWAQQKFEAKANKNKELAIESLQSSSCSLLKYGKKSKDGKYCSAGYMIIGKDNLSFDEQDLSICYGSYGDIKNKLAEHYLCQLSDVALKRKRQQDSKNLAKYGRCKRLEKGVKNNQEYFCSQGFSFVTIHNDLVGNTTKCYSSVSAVYDAMQQEPVCSMSNSEFRSFELNKKRAFERQLITNTCQIVNKSYERISCPTGFGFTILKKNNQSKPINNNCYATKSQALNAMKKIDYCY